MHACRARHGNGAALTDLDLSGADLRGADFSRSKSITVKSTDGAIVDDATELPPDADWQGLVQATDSTDLNC